MKIFITGASSTLGKNLTSELLKTGKFSIRLLEHHSPVPKKQCETFRGDIQDPDFLLEACSGVDTVFHLASLTHSSSRNTYFEVNESGTGSLITSCQKNNVRRLIFVSSSAASEEGGDYAVSKLRSEELVRESGLEWVILRPSEVYGPNMDEGIGKLVTCVKIFPIIPIIGNGSYFLSPVHVDDVIQAMVEILENDSIKKETLNLCGPEKMTMNELIDRLALIQNLKRKIVFLPLWLVRVGIGFLEFLKPGFAFSDQIPRLLCDKNQSISLTQALISYNPRKIEEGFLSLPYEKTQPF